MSMKLFNFDDGLVNSKEFSISLNIPNIYPASISYLNVEHCTVYTMHACARPIQLHFIYFQRPKTNEIQINTWYMV